MRTDGELAALVGQSYVDEASVSGFGDVRAVFYSFPDEFVVAISGTRHIPGWIRDFEFWPEAHPLLGRVHSGFLKNGLALWALIKGPVLAASAAGKRVTYAGHSLGAAEAQICAALHVLYDAKGVRIVTFGSPRVALWANLFFRKLLLPVSMALYKRAGDPVPHVPPIWWYGHVRLNTIIGAAVPGSDAGWPLDPVNDPNHGIVHYAADLKAPLP